MPDITMCRDDKCPKCKTCYRFNALPNPYYQSYFVESPRQNDTCDWYIVRRFKITRTQSKNSKENEP